MNGTLHRFYTGDDGTKGVLLLPGLAVCTMELPWRDNAPNVSCIPAGEYPVALRNSPRYGSIYHVKNVPGRSYILLHWGNWAGDVSLGYRSNVEGCVLLGKYHAEICGQRAVANSRTTVRKFMEHLGGQAFTLKIVEEY